MQQQKKAIDKLKEKTENCETLKNDSSIANRFTNAFTFEIFDMEMKTEDFPLT